MRAIIKNKLKEIVKPFLPAIFPLLVLRINGKSLLINRFTAKLPFFGTRLQRLERIRIFYETDKHRELDYQKWLKKNQPTKDTLLKQKLHSKQLSRQPLVSIVMPTYNTNLDFLKECIESVADQTYENWELCIADDRSTDPRVRDLIEELSKEDKRIKYKFLEKNGHICRASNAALELVTGEYVGLLDHDDLLQPNALFEIVRFINDTPIADLIYTDEDKIDEKSKIRSSAFLKPDWSPEYLRSVNYITHFAVIRTSIIKKAGGFRIGYEGAQDWDLFLRISDITENIFHIPKVLYSWRISKDSTAQHSENKQYAYDNQRKVLKDDVKRRGLTARLRWEIRNFTWRIDYEVKHNPKISIVIPTKDCYELIDKCLRSINAKTKYYNYEIIVVDTGSIDSRVWKVYDRFKKNKNFKLLKWKKEFNFSAVCNFGAEHAKGEYFLFLNNDTEVISPNWIRDMVGFAQQDGIGAVGVKLLYPSKRLQHGGIVLGVGGDPKNKTPGIAGHFFPNHFTDPPQDPMQNQYIGGARNFTAVTAACIMIMRSRFDEVGGFDPAFKIAFNDVDFCLKLHSSGYRNVFLPHVKLYHHESVSVGAPGEGKRDNDLFLKEINMMHKKWRTLIEHDPYYHDEFRRDSATARLKV